MLFQVEIVTPKGLFKKLDVDSLNIKLTSGFRTILAGHTDLIGAIEIAPMHVTIGDKTLYFSLHGGVLEIKKGKVLIIANSIEALKEN